MLEDGPASTTIVFFFKDNGLSLFGQKDRGHKYHGQNDYCQKDQDHGIFGKTMVFMEY